jgi:hypothetical protein
MMFLVNKHSISRFFPLKQLFGLPISALQSGIKENNDSENGVVVNLCWRKANDKRKGYMVVCLFPKS